MPGARGCEEKGRTKREIEVLSPVVSTGMGGTYFSTSSSPVTTSFCQMTKAARSIHAHVYKRISLLSLPRVQELCDSRGGRPGLPVLMSLMVSADVKQH